MVLSVAHSIRAEPGSSNSSVTGMFLGGIIVRFLFVVFFFVTSFGMTFSNGARNVRYSV